MGAIVHKKGVTFRVWAPFADKVNVVGSSVGNSVIHNPDFDWGESDNFQIAPWNKLIIYEMHIGTFHDDPGGAPGTFQSAREKLPYLG